MSAHRGKADLAESMIGAELLWRRRALHRTSRPGDRRTAHSATAGLIPQLPARRRFHRTLLISAGPSSWARAAVPYRAVRMAGFDGTSAKIRTTIDTLELKMRLAIAISN